MRWVTGRVARMISRRVAGAVTGRVVTSKITRRKNVLITMGSDREGDAGKRYHFRWRH